MAKKKIEPRDALDELNMDIYRYNLDVTSCRLERDNVVIRQKDLDDMREICKIIWPEQFPEKKHILLGPNDPIPEEAYFIPYDARLREGDTEPIRKIDIRPKHLRDADNQPNSNQKEKENMSTQRQRESARENAQHSTGPRTEEGKAKSSMNALKSGLDAKSMILPYREDPAALEQLTTEWYTQHPPLTTDIRILVDQCINAEWLLRRYAVTETQVHVRGMEHAYHLSENAPLGHSYLNMSNTLGRLQRHKSALKKDFLIDLQTLKTLEAAAKAEAEAKAKAETEKADQAAESSTTQATESTTETKKSGSFRKPSVPLPNHPEKWQDCPTCALVGHFRAGCTYQKPPQK